MLNGTDLPNDSRNLLLKDLPPNFKNPRLFHFSNDYPPASDKWLRQMDGQNCPTSNRTSSNSGHLLNFPSVFLQSVCVPAKKRRLL